jgi:hypothetical protein
MPTKTPPIHGDMYRTLLPVGREKTGLAHGAGTLRDGKTGALKTNRRPAMPDAYR